MLRKKLGQLVKTAIVLGLSLVSLGAHSADQVTLKLFNWPDYIAPSVLVDFEKQHNIKVEVVPYESDELKDDLLLRTNGGEGMDIIVSARHSMMRLIRQKWVLPLDNNALPNRQHLTTRFDVDRDQLKDYALPYLWGTLGIAWRKDKVEKPLTSWREFFEPAPALKGHIMMINDSQDAIGMALKAAGHSANDTTPDALDKAKALLATQQPFVAKYGYPALDNTSELLGDDVWVAMMFNGDALTLKDLNPNIEYRVPREGGNIWVDYLGILAKTKYPKEAHLLVNFLCDPKVAADNAISLNFAPANTSAEKLLPLPFLKNRAIYPPKNTLGQSQQYTDLTPEQQKQRTDLFLDISN